MKPVNAELEDVLGPAVGPGPVRFVPVVVRGEPSPRPFAALAAHAVAPGLRSRIGGAQGAAWVRARWPRVFGLEPLHPVEVGGGTLFRETLLAVDGAAAWAFDVEEARGDAVARWRGAGPPELRVAAALWDLLLAEPDGLADYHLWVDHPPEVDGRVEYQCRRGVLVREEYPT